MRVKARKVGNSMTVTIPRDVVLEMDIAEDTDLNIFVRDGAVVLEPVVSRWDRVVARVRAHAAEAGIGESDIDEEMEQLRPGRFTTEESSGECGA